MTRFEKCHAAIHRAFLAKGGTEAQWARVNADPRKFNRAWRRVLGLPDSTQPPPVAYRCRCPFTGELFADD